MNAINKLIRFDQNKKVSCGNGGAIGSKRRNGKDASQAGGGGSKESVRESAIKSARDRRALVRANYCR